jgi:hypothetical protein
VDHDLLNIASELPCGPSKPLFSAQTGEGKANTPMPRAEQARLDIPLAQRHRVIEILLAFDCLPAAMFARENKLMSLK